MGHYTIEDARKLRTKWRRKIRRESLKATCGETEAARKEAAIMVIEHLAKYQTELRVMGFKESPMDSPMGEGKLIPADTAPTKLERWHREMNHLAVAAASGDVEAAKLLLQRSMNGRPSEEEANAEKALERAARKARRA